MSLFDENVTAIKSRPAVETWLPNYQDITISGSLPSRSTVPTVTHASFSSSLDNITRESLQNAYQERCKIIYQPNSDATMITEIEGYLAKNTRSFNYSLNVSAQSVKSFLREIMQREQWPIGRGEAFNSFLNQAKDDVVQFLEVSGESECVLRFVLEDMSVLYDVLADTNFESIGDARTSVLKKISDLSYSESFLYHIDDYPLNFSRIYHGYPTICFGGTMRGEVRDNFLDGWIKCFCDPIDFHAEISEALFKGNREAAKELLGELAKQIYSFQLTMDGAIRDGAEVFQFEQGAGHYYFGASYEFGQEEQLDQERLLFHARPMVWALNPRSKRMATLIESTENFDSETFFRV